MAGTKPPGSMADGKYPITDAKSLKAAVHLVGHSTTHSTAEVKAHIKRRATALGLAKQLPADWLTQETTPRELIAPLSLEAIGLKPTIVQEASTENGGVMRVRVPFFKGNSLTQAKGFPKKILFQESILPAIIQEGKAAIASRKPPLTVYARHAHAMSAEHLPIGGVVDLEQEGSVGYAILDVLDVKPNGAHVQALIQHQLLDSTSLRANEYRMVSGRVNGQSVLVCEGLTLAGIDMAPDGPAQDTYGIEVLSQEAVIEPDAPETPPAQGRHELDDQPLTLEAVKAQAPAIVDEIERPLRLQLETVTNEKNALLQEKAILGRDAAIAEIATRTNDPAEFAKTLREVCESKGINDAPGVSTIVAPLLLQEMERMRNTTQTPAQTQEQKLAALFSVSGAGSTTAVVVPEADKTPVLSQEVLSIRGTVDGGLIPEDF